MRKNILILGILSVLLITLSFLGEISKKVPMETGILEHRNLTIGKITISVEIPKTEKELERGLGGRLGIATTSGMLFDFGNTTGYGIWMKDMLFPIDVIWLDQNLTIVDITPHMEPSSYPKIFTSKAPTRYALEVPSGFAEKNDLQIGDEATFLQKISRNI